MSLVRDDDGRLWDHGWVKQRMAGVLRSWPTGMSGQRMKDSAELLLEVLDSVDFEDECFVLNDVETALEINRLRQIIEHISIQVVAWCVRSTYNPEGEFRPGDTVVWAAFLTKKQAEVWLPYYEKKFENRIEHGDVYEVVLCPAPLNRIYTEGANPGDQDWS